jgi:hypothetical protein
MPRNPENEILEFDQVLAHFERSINNRDAIKANILGLIEWLNAFNKTLNKSPRIFCYRREEVNVGFALDWKGNRERSRTPNFLVIKLEKTDRADKEAFLEFNMGDTVFVAPPNVQLISRRFDLFRLVGNNIAITDLKQIVELAEEAYRRKILA